MTKNNNPERTAEITITYNTIVNKVLKGDYIILGKLLKIDGNTARMRFHRKNEEAVCKMSSLIDSREKFLESQTK